MAMRQQRGWEIPESLATPEDVFLNRRSLLKGVAAGAILAAPLAASLSRAAIAAADPGFDLLGFLEGAKGAYGMILEAFWKGDKDTLRELTDDDVYESFAQAIEAREEAGETLDNRLIRIEDATVRSAELDGRTARIAVLFVADIAAVTRNADGTVVAGSLDDAIESRDVWTFRRNVGAADPNWVLDETDEG